MKKGDSKIRSKLTTRGNVPQEKEAAHGGPGWIARPTRMLDEIGSIWSDFGVQADCGILRSVLLRRPGPEIDEVLDPSDALWISQLDAEKARDQHDHLAELYRQNGVTVYYVEDCPLEKPNMYFCRDLFAMTSLGAIISRPASMTRAGEERYISKSIADLGIPILLSVHGDGTFEGADLLIVNPDLVFIGEGIRTNISGTVQIRQLLESIGYPQIEVIQLNYGCGHLDGVLSIIDKDLAVIYPTQLSYRAWHILKRHGFRILDLPSKREAHFGMALNMVPLAPGVVVIPKDNPKTCDVLQKHGVTCIEVNVSELMKGGGAVHCMTGVLKREPL